MHKNNHFLAFIKIPVRLDKMRKLIAIILCFISLIPAYAQNNSNAANSQTLLEQPVDLVNPLIGSDRCRNFFMTAAARPFGMVKLAPDTEISGY